MKKTRRSRRRSRIWRRMASAEHGYSLSELIVVVIIIAILKKMADEQKIEVEATDTGYPESLEVLVQGAKLTGEGGRLFKFLRKIPRDPMTGRREWGLRGSQDEPDSEAWDGEDVFDVFSLSEATALDGTKYRDW